MSRSAGRASAMPLAPGAAKEDLDGFLVRVGPHALSELLLRASILLAAFIARLPLALRAQAD